MRATHPGGRRDALTNQTRTAQLDHLAAVVTLETISFGVISAGAEMHAITRCGFHPPQRQDRRLGVGLMLGLVPVGGARAGVRRGSQRLAGSALA